MLIEIKGMSTTGIFIPEPEHFEALEQLSNDGIAEQTKEMVECMGVQVFIIMCLRTGAICCLSHAKIIVEVALYMVGHNITDPKTYYYEQKTLS